MRQFVLKLLQPQKSVFFNPLTLMEKIPFAFGMKIAISKGNINQTQEERMKIKTKLATMGIAILALPLLALVNLPHKVFGKVATVDKSRAEAKTNCGGVTDTGGEHPSGQK